MSVLRKRRVLLAVVGAATLELGCPDKQPPGNLMAPIPVPKDAGVVEAPPAPSEPLPPKFPVGNLMAPVVPSFIPDAGTKAP